MQTAERRSGRERRKRNLKAYMYGGLFPRRMGGRRVEDRIYPIIDWHKPRVLAVVLAILGLCVMDAVLTVILLQHGATEANPLMALFVPHELYWFATVKLGLTAGGLLVLVACSRMKLMRFIPAELVLFGVLIAYTALIAYELRLLPRVQGEQTHSHSLRAAQQLAVVVANRDYGETDLGRGRLRAIL